MKTRIATLAAAAVVSASCTPSASAVPFTAVLPSAQFTASAAENSVKFISANGYAEGAYVMWSSVSGAGGYNVYADGVQLDSMLIRQYSGYMRADAVGLTSGSHTLKVVPVIGGSEDASKSAEITVTSYANDRSGFAFVSGSSNGAYNSDGTLKSDALVVYVTNSNKDSVSAKIDATGKGAENVTGFQNIITAYKKGKEDGYAEGIEEGKAAAKAELLGDMGTPCTDCTAVEVTDGTTTVTLYKPTKVGYIKK